MGAMRFNASRLLSLPLAAISHVDGRALSAAPGPVTAVRVVLTARPSGYLTLGEIEVLAREHLLSR